MPYEIALSAAAQKNLDRLQNKIRTRIADALEDLRDEPRPRSSRKLAGSERLWRIRVGNYRVIYTIEGDELIILVVRVAHRKDAYRGL